MLLAEAEIEDGLADYIDYEDVLEILNNGASQGVFLMEDDSEVEYLFFNVLEIPRLH